MQSEKNRSCGRLICRDSSQEHLTGATPPLALLAHLGLSARWTAYRTPLRGGLRQPSESSKKNRSRGSGSQKSSGQPGVATRCR